MKILMRIIVVLLLKPIELAAVIFIPYWAGKLTFCQIWPDIFFDAPTPVIWCGGILECIVLPIIFCVNWYWAGKILRKSNA